MTPKKIVRVFFFVLSLLLISLAYILQINNQQLLYDVMKDIGVVLLSIVILDIIWRFAGGDSNEESANLNKFIKVYRTVHEVEKDFSWIDLARRSKSKVDLQALSLAYLSSNDEFMRVIKEKVIEGVTVRVVLMSPDHPLLEEPLENLGSFIYPKEIKLMSRTSADRFEKMQRELGDVKSKRGSLTIVLNKSRPMSISVKRFDNELFVQHYEWNVHTVNTPVYYFAGGEKQPLFERYVQIFEDQFTALLISSKLQFKS
ncbi:hypothetical protein KJ068_25645 [bacterium]|nr:hypothetical protein [bacterium]